MISARLLFLQYFTVVQGIVTAWYHPGTTTISTTTRSSSTSRLLSRSQQWKPQPQSYYHPRTLLFLAPQQLGSYQVLQVDTKSCRTVRLHHRGLGGSTNVTAATAVSTSQLVPQAYHQEPPIPFETAWEWQRQFLNEHVERLATKTTNSSSTQFFLSSQHQTQKETNDGSPQKGVDTVIMLQHTPVYTLGTGSDEAFILSESNSVPTVRMDRGGEVTYHGPGQLTVYPILDLRSYRQDIHWYIRALEESILLALQHCGITNAYRKEGITGIWIEDCKVAAVGIKCRKWITMHGLAVNVEDISLQHFSGIVPCGLVGHNVGCINQFLEQKEQGNSAAPKKVMTVGEFAVYMKQALEEVFQIQLIDQIHRG